MAGKFIHVKFEGAPLLPKYEHYLARVENYLWAAQTRQWHGQQLTERQERNLSIFGSVLQHYGRVKYLNTIEAREHDRQCVQRVLLDIFENHPPRRHYKPRVKK